MHFYYAGSDAISEPISNQDTQLNNGNIMLLFYEFGNSAVKKRVGMFASNLGVTNMQNILIK